MQPRHMILRRNPRRRMMRVDRDQRAAALPRQIPVHRHRPRKARVVGLELDLPHHEQPVIERRNIDFHNIAIVVARSEEHTSELQSLMLTSYAYLCLKKKNTL